MMSSNFPRVRAFLVGVVVPHIDSPMGVEESLDELGSLAETLGIEVVGQSFQRLRKVNPMTLLGSGKLEEVKQWIAELGVDLLIFDDELSPRHQRELEEFCGADVRILDRTAIVLDIFAQHARTQESSLQVSLAQYEYRLPRLTRQWTHLARQAGGSNRTGGVGAVGLRGPGETQLETDRREIKRRISKLRRDLADLHAHRATQRARRHGSGIPQVTLIGYTNAGKSTLLNSLCHSDALVADQLFATLDPTTRRYAGGSKEPFLVSDTVGMIHKLPHHLIATFMSTLNEITQADVLLHVVDVGDLNALARIAIVDEIVRSLGWSTTPETIMVLNKIDTVSSAEEREALDHLVEAYPDAVIISAARNIGVNDLVQRIRLVLRQRRIPTRVFVPYGQYEIITRFHEVAYDVTEAFLDNGVELSGMVQPDQYEGFGRYIVR